MSDVRLSWLALDKAAANAQLSWLALSPVVAANASVSWLALQPAQAVNAKVSWLALQPAQAANANVSWLALTSAPYASISMSWLALGSAPLADVRMTQLVLSAAVTGGGYEDDKPKKKKSYVVKVDGRLMAFSRQQDALDALDRDQPKQYPAKKAALPPVAPDREVALAAVSAMIAKATYQAALEQKQYETLMLAYDAAQQDEDDLELLLMSL